MEMFPLVSILLIYFVTAFVKPHVKSRLKFNPCAICFAVGLTWVMMLVLYFAGWDVSVISLTVLMGMSIAGFMYKAETFYKEKKIQNFWFVRLVIILGGFYLVQALFERQWNWFLMLIVVILVTMVMATVFFQDVTSRSSVAKHIKKLDDCC